MANGNDIIVEAAPRGTKMEGILGANSGSPKPGTIMEIDRSVEPVNGTFAWEPFGVTAASGSEGVAADGNQRLVAVLEIDKLQGKTADDAYATTERCFLYVPVAGETLNIRRADIAGSGDDVAIGDLFIVEDGTGKLIATTGSPESEPFFALETVTDPLAETLLWCMYTGY